MATNVRSFGYDPDRKTEALRIENIKPGNTLIQVTTGSYGSDRWDETVWTVAKVLKTRLVLERFRVVRRRIGTSDQYESVTERVEARVLVRFSKSWTGQNGLVETTLEGTANEWHRDSFDLYTPDEPELAARRERHNRQVEDRRIQREATEALNAFKVQLTVENAEEAIVKLQAWVAAKNKKD